MMPAVLLPHPGQEARHIHEGQERDVEGVAGPDEPGGLDRSVDVERAGQHRRLLGDDPDAPPAQAREPDQDVRRPIRLDLEEVAVVDDAPDDLVHVVGLRGSSGTSVSRGRDPDGRPGRRSPPGRRLARLFCGRWPRSRRTGSRALGLVLRSDVGHAADSSCASAAPPRSSASTSSCVTARTTFGAGHEHVARALHHDREVGDGGRVDRAAGAWPRITRDLRHDPGRQHVAQEDVGVAAERDDALLDPRAAGIVQADDRGADLHRQVHDLADLLGVRLRERAAEDREVLAEDEDRAAVDRPWPVTTPSPRKRWLSSPKSVARCVTNASSSTNDPGSSRSSSRSRAVSLPRACWLLDSRRTSTPQGLRSHPPQLLKPLFAARHVDLLEPGAGDEDAGGAVLRTDRWGRECAMIPIGRLGAPEDLRIGSRSVPRPFVFGGPGDPAAATQRALELSTEW